MIKNNQCRWNQLAKIVIKRLSLICLHTIHEVVITAILVRRLFGQCLFSRVVIIATVAPYVCFHNFS